MEVSSLSTKGNQDVGKSLEGFITWLYAKPLNLEKAVCSSPYRSSTVMGWLQGTASPLTRLVAAAWQAGQFPDGMPSIAPS